MLPIGKRLLVWLPSTGASRLGLPNEAPYLNIGGAEASAGEARKNHRHRVSGSSFFCCGHHVFSLLHSHRHQRLPSCILLFRAADMPYAQDQKHSRHELLLSGKTHVAPDTGRSLHAVPFVEVTSQLTPSYACFLPIYTAVRFKLAHTICLWYLYYHRLGWVFGPWFTC